MAQMTVPSPIGPLTLHARGEAIARLSWDAQGQPSRSTRSTLPTEATPLLREAAAQLGAYFAGDLAQFDLPLALPGGLAGGVCAEMLRIPLGETRRYGDLARALGSSAQAVGQACGANPIPVIVPCHRILSASGLGGYSGQGGVETKVWLLRHEGAGGLLI